jgi:hypothetical protein
LVKSEEDGVMKKLLVMSVLALAVSMACQQTASAWSEFKFSAGVNFGWVGGGNRFFWGLYRSAPYPGGPDLPPVFGQAFLAQQAPHGGFGGGYAPGPYIPGPVGPGMVSPHPPTPYGPGFQGPPPAPYHDEASLWSPAPPISSAVPFGPSDIQLTDFPGSYYQAPATWYGR